MPGISTGSWAATCARFPRRCISTTAGQPEDGGQLRIYTGGGASVDVLPQGGRLVAFQSDRFEHEVLPARRERMSFTGWFRRRPLEGFV